MTIEFPINHLWQSSGIALLAGLLAFLLRNGPPKVRYWIWLSASLKFLLPLSLLMSLGSMIPRSTPRATGTATPVLTDTITDTIIEIAVPYSAPTQTATHGAPIAIAIVWTLGFLAIAFVRCRAWLHIRSTLQAATPIELPIPIPAFIAPHATEPGIVGFLKPILLLPPQLPDNLNASQLNALLAHEMSHVRRRDNLFAAIHMGVEAIFWFNPLVWWIGSRMIEERERACDEAVLQTGCEPADYVEGILKVARLYKKSELPCIAGVTGADIKKRILAILSENISSDLSAAKKAALAAAALAILATPLIIGILTAPIIRAQIAPANTPKFEVASVKAYKDSGIGPRNAHSTYNPQGVDFGARTIAFLIGEAWDMPVDRIVPAPTKTKDELLGRLREGYDVVAKADHSTSKPELRLMLQALLADRFQLTLHHEAMTRPVYKLVIAKGGSKLQASEDDGDLVMAGSPEGFAFRNAEVFRLAGYLSGHLDRMVVDETELKGLYNFAVKLPEDLRGSQPAKSDRSPDSPSAGLFADVLKPLGLQLIAGTAQVDYLVVDHVERPSEN